MDSITLSNPLSKADGLEAMSLSFASLKDAEGRQEDSITTERLEKGNTILDTYKIISDPISGGMGSVWQVYHEGWKLELAMKRPRPRFFAEGGPERRKNFLRECENWIRLGLHPNIVSCYYVREISGVPSVFSEWMDGGSLKDRIRDQSLYSGTSEEVQERILDIAVQAARGLMYSHANGLLHQDMKPGNLLLTGEWDAKIADFGLANSGSYPDAKKSMGYTPEYCPREQAEGARPARWMDVYAWALTVLEMYAGGRLWEKGEEAEEQCGLYFERCRVKVPAHMRLLIVSCLTEKLNGFGSVLPSLEQIYSEVTGRRYPRKYPEKAASDTADSLNNRAMSYLDLGMPEEAQKLWEEALLREPDHADTIFNRELYLLRNSRKTDTQVRLVLNSYETTKAIGAADLIAMECGGTYEVGTESAHSWNCPKGNVFDISKIESDAVYTLIIARDHPRTLTGLSVVPADGSSEKEYLDPLDEIREKEYELYPWVSELEQYLRPKKDSRIEFMDVHSGKGWAAFMVFDTVCLYDLKERKIIGEYKTNDYYPKTAFKFNPEGTRLILFAEWGKGRNETLLLEVPAMRAVLEEKSCFIGFGPGEKTLLRRPAGDRELEVLVEVDADGSERVLHCFEEELSEYHEFIGAKAPYLCYRAKESGETFCLDSQYRRVPVSEPLFEAAKDTCFYDPGRQLLYSGVYMIQVWDAEKGEFLFTSQEGLSDFRWDESRQAFLSHSNEYVGALSDGIRWMWTPLPRRKENIQPAQWMISHIVTSRKRVSEDERIHTLFEAFERATDDDTARAIEIYREARTIEGFAFTEEADYMMEWLDEYAERTGILEVRPLGEIEKIPPVTETVYQTSSCDYGWKAFYADNGGYRIVLMNRDGEFVREVKLPKCRAAARGSRIYAFMGLMQWAAYDLWGNVVREPKGGWPSRFEQNSAAKIHYNYCDMDSAGSRALFNIYDEIDRENCGTFLLKMDSGNILRLSDQSEFSCFLKDDTAVLVTEESVRRFDPADGRLIGKADEIPDGYVFGLFTSQERDRFFIRTGKGVWFYDMNCVLLGKCDVPGDRLHVLPGGRFIKSRDCIWNVFENKIEAVIRTPGTTSSSSYRCVTVSADGREVYAERRRMNDPGEVTRFRLEYDYSLKAEELLEIEKAKQAKETEKIPGAEEVSEAEMAEPLKKAEEMSEAEKAEPLKKAEEIPAAEKVKSSKKEGTRKKGFFSFLFGRKKTEQKQTGTEQEPVGAERKQAGAERKQTGAEQKQAAAGQPDLPDTGDAFAEENLQLRESRRRHTADDQKLEKYLRDPFRYPPVKEYREPDKRRPAGSRPYVNLADAIVRYEDLDDKARIMVKVRVNDIECLSNPAVSETFDRICLELGENGRLLTRRSGVIPEIAILIEADTDRKCITYMNRFLDVLWEEGFTVGE